MGVNEYVDYIKVCKSPELDTFLMNNIDTINEIVIVEFELPYKFR